MLQDREKFLLSELNEFLTQEGLLAEDYSDKVLIIPAGNAWEYYLQFGIYKCQESRTFQLSSYMAFYNEGEIKEKNTENNWLHRFIKLGSF